MIAKRYWEGMTMKKALLLFIVAIAIIFNSVGFFAIGQDRLPEKQDQSMLHISDETGYIAIDAAGASVAGIEADSPLSIAHFTLLLSSLIIMLLIVNKSNQN